MLTDRYIDYLRGIRRYSSRTCTVYSEILRDYLSFCEISDDENLPECLTPTMIRGYEVDMMDRRKLSSTTVHLHLSVLSGLCRFLMKDGRLQSNPVRLTPRPKKEKRIPVFFREESMKEYFDINVEFAEYRKKLARLIVTLLYGTGMRRSELIGLKINDFDPFRRVLHVKGKGNKMRDIPLVDELCQEISLYLPSVERMNVCERTAESPLLVTEKGKALYPVYVDRVIKTELGAIGSITGRKSPHVLRHTLATELLNNGADLESIKELLGHSSLGATQVYTHTSIERLKSVYNDAHPRAKSGEK